MDKVQSVFVCLAGCVTVSLFTGCAVPKGFSVRAPEKPVLNYDGMPYEDAWKDLIAFMEGDAKWCIGSIEDMSKTDAYVRTSWRTSNNLVNQYQTRVMARFNDARDRVEFTPEAMFQTVPGYSTEIANRLKVAIRLHDSKIEAKNAKLKLERTNKILSEDPPQRVLPLESEEDKAIKKRLVGKWSAETSGEVMTAGPNIPVSRTPFKSIMVFDFNADGGVTQTSTTILTDKRLTDTAKGTWNVRGNRFFYRQEMQGPNGVMKSDMSIMMLWKDSDSWEMRDDPDDEITNARNKTLGQMTKITYDADGTQRTLSVNGGIKIESTTTPCIFKRVSVSGS